MGKQISYNILLVALFCLVGISFVTDSAEAKIRYGRWNSKSSFCKAVYKRRSYRYCMRTVTYRKSRTHSSNRTRKTANKWLKWRQDCRTNPSHPCRDKFKIVEGQSKFGDGFKIMRLSKAEKAKRISLKAETKHKPAALEVEKPIDISHQPLTDKKIAEKKLKSGHQKFPELKSNERPADFRLEKPAEESNSLPKDVSSAQVEKQIIANAKKFNSCRSSRVPGRGKISNGLGYFEGMVVSFARSICRENSDPVKQAMARQSWRTGSKDALKYYQSKGLIRPYASLKKDSEKHLISIYSILLPHGMRESSGRYNEGRDRSVSMSRQKAWTAEAGLFQTSYDVHGVVRKNKIGHKALQDLMQQYKKNPSACLTNVFKKANSKSTRSAIVRNGGGSRARQGAEFQHMMRTCPAFAVEHTAITVRYARKHYGPINRRETRPIKKCQKMFESIYENVKSNRQKYCGALSVTKKAAPKGRWFAGARKVGGTQ